MHHFKSYVGVAIWGALVTTAPLASRSGLITQDPKSYTHISASDVIAAGQSGTASHGGVTKGAQAGPDPDDDDPDDPDDDDDDEDLIPGDLLEGDNDSGGESDVGNDAVSVANGLLGSGGAGSAALNNQTSGSTAVFCSLFACASAAQSDGKVSTSATGARIHASGPLISIKGPLVVIQASRTSVRKTLSSKGEGQRRGTLQDSKKTQ